MNSNRSHLTSRTDRSSAEKNVEAKLKMSMENIRTLSATLNETQGELESLVKKHESVVQQLTQSRTEAQRFQSLLTDANEQLQQIRKDAKEEQLRAA